MADWIQALRIAVAITCMLLVTLYLADSLYKSAFFRGEVEMLKKCQNGFPPCKFPHNHPKDEPPVIQTLAKGETWPISAF